MRLLKALAVQLLATAAVMLVCRWGYCAALPLGVLQGVIAALLARLFHHPLWWQVIHLMFLPILLWLLTLALPVTVYAVGFVVLVLLFWGTVKGDVPLFLSSSAVSQAVLERVARDQPASFIDLGAGLGSVVVPLARQCPALEIHAIERAPLPCLWLWLRCRRYRNIHVQWGSFWTTSLSDYGMVFAFLSPLVMARLGEKAAAEMHIGSVLLSASFPINEWQADDCIQLNDSRSTVLYCYYLPVVSSAE